MNSKQGMKRIRTDSRYPLALLKLTHHTSHPWVLVGATTNAGKKVRVKV